MGMYCCCGSKIYEKNPNCLCNWDGWTSIIDWPEERKNRETPIALPLRDGKYLVRIQSSSGDRYEEELLFSKEPRIEIGGYFFPQIPYELHWENESWQEGTPYAWKEINEHP